jgi:hypothetical protein
MAFGPFFAGRSEVRLHDGPGTLIELVCAEVIGIPSRPVFRQGGAGIGLAADREEVFDSRQHKRRRLRFKQFAQSFVNLLEESGAATFEWLVPGCPTSSLAFSTIP